VRTLAVLSETPNPKFSLGHPWEPADRLLVSDRYWMARQVRRIPRALIERAAMHAKLEPPIAAHVVRALESRRHKLMDHWLAKVTPLEVVSLHDGVLILADSAIAHGSAIDEATLYHVSFLDDSGDEVARPAVALPQAGKLILFLPRALLRQPYFIVRIVAERYSRGARAFEAHIATAGSARVIGVRR
jgi:hypothetical protein